MAQSNTPSKNPFAIEVTPAAGFIWKHNSTVDHLDGHVTGCGISLFQEAIGKQAWKKIYGYPVVGVSLLALHYHLPEMGQTVALTPFVEPVFYRGEGFLSTFRLSTGLTYVTQPFNLASNSENMALSARISSVIELQFRERFTLTEHLGLSASLGLTHYSNGAIKMPNSGINVPIFMLGLFYMPKGYERYDKTSTPLKKEELIYTAKESWVIDIEGRFSIRQIEPTSNPYNPVYLTMVNVGYRVSPISLPLVGIAYAYNTSLSTGNPWEEPRPRYYRNRLSIMAGHELIAGKVAFSFMIGAYLYQPGRKNYEQDLYQRVGIKYQFTPKWFSHASFKTHLGRAEYYGIGLGYRITGKDRRGL